jgi:hypothetical protein
VPVMVILANCVRSDRVIVSVSVLKATSVLLLHLQVKCTRKVCGRVLLLKGKNCIPLVCAFYYWLKVNNVDV